MKLLMLFAGAYIAGSVNFSILLFKLLKKEDPRNGFSKNPGTFNVYRQHGFFWALMVLILDVGRSLGVAFISASLLQTALIPWVGLGLILGNRLPSFHQFRGGKGVANYLGFSAFIAPSWALAAIVAWLICYKLFRIPFIGSLIMVLILAVGTLLACNFDPFAASGILFTVVVIFYSHKSNFIAFFQRGEAG
jgi:acyl phosphate:glycerol-3-phosphate acyltransferase